MSAKIFTSSLVTYKLKFTVDHSEFKPSTEALERTASRFIARAANPRAGTEAQKVVFCKSTNAAM